MKITTIEELTKIISNLEEMINNQHEFHCLVFAQVTSIGDLKIVMYNNLRGVIFEIQYLNGIWEFCRMYYNSNFNNLVEDAKKWMTDNLKSPQG